MHRSLRLIAPAGVLLAGLLLNARPAAAVTPAQPQVSAVVTCGAINYTLTDLGGTDLHLLISDMPPGGPPYAGQAVTVPAGQTVHYYYQVPYPIPAQVGNDDVQLYWNQPSGSSLLLDNQVRNECSSPTPAPTKPSYSISPGPRPHHVNAPAVASRPAAHLSAVARPARLMHPAAAAAVQPQLANTGPQAALWTLIGVFLLALGSLCVLAGRSWGDRSH